MRTNLALVMGLALLGAACGGGKPSVNLQAEGEKIRALDEKWVKAAADKNLEKAIAVYAADAVFMEPNEPLKSGPELRKAWEEMLKLPNVALSFTPTSINVSDDGTMAYDVGTYQFAFDDPKAGHVQDHGKYLVVWRRSSDSDWKVVADTFNTDVPMAPPPTAAGPTPSPQDAAKAAAQSTAPAAEPKK